MTAESAVVMLQVLIDAGMIHEECQCGCLREHHDEERRKCWVCNDFCPYEITWRPSTPIREVLSRTEGQ